MLSGISTEVIRNIVRANEARLLDFAARSLKKWRTVPLSGQKSGAAGRLVQREYFDSDEYTQPIA
jgi:hypothetical protein